MDEFKVDIKFPRKTDPDPNIVTIVGTEENVADAKDRLLNLAEEYVSIFKVSNISVWTYVRDQRTLVEL